MSKKRTSAESCFDEQTIECSDSVFQQEDNAKRVKLDSLSGTTLQDLPIALLEYILVKAVAMKVKDSKLAKRVWGKKSDHVISILRTVSSQWSSILTTNTFRDKLHRALYGTDQDTFRLEILHQSQIQEFVFRVATMKDEMFMLCKPANQDPFINVCERDNMVRVKDVIPLPGIHPEDMVACSVSNCLYVLNKDSHYFSVLRITKNEEHQFNISPWINDLSLSFPAVRLFVSVNGSLIILSKQLTPRPSIVCIYSANGSLQHAITLFPAIHGFRLVFSVIQKSNGNLVLATVSDALHTELKEIDTIGKIVRHYRSTLFGDSGVTVADANGRIMIAGVGNSAELLDSEFNLLDLTVSKKNEGFVQIPFGMHYNSERNEIVRLFEISGANSNRALTIFRFR